MIKKEHQRFSLRKYKIGVSSVFLGFGLSFALAGTGEAQAAETKAETAAPKTQVTAAEVTTEAPTTTPAKTEEATPVVKETDKVEADKEEVKKEEATKEEKSVVDESNKPKVRNRRSLDEANAVNTNGFNSELQNAAQKTAIYSPGVKGEKQTYEGTVWLYRNGTVSNPDQEDAKRLGNVNVYLQYVTGKGFVSPVYKTTSEQDGTFVFDLSKPVANRLGATGEFQLAGDPDLAIRTWVENPDPKKYNVVKAGDQRTGFHTRLVRLNESWNFTAGINRITGGQVVLQEKPNSEDYLLKP